MKKITFLSLIGILIGLSFPSFASIEDTLTEIVEPVALANVNNEFKISKDSLTLVPFKYGNQSFKIADIDAKFISIKYSLRGKNNWNIKTVENIDSTIIIEKVDQNQLYDYNFGYGDSESEITYESTPRTFNTYYESIFENLSSKAKTEAVEIMWGINRTTLNNLLEIYPNASFIIKYNTKVFR